MLVYFLYGLFLLACIVVIVSVLLQPGKADAGALFTSSVSSSAFGPRGTQTLLSKITIIATIVFMLTALMLSLPALTGSRSVLQTTTPEATPTPAPTPAPTPQATPAAPAAAPDANANSGSAPASNATSGNANGAAPSNANR